ncbi:MAG: ATP-binding protein [Bacteroidota bacterium]
MITNQRYRIIKENEHHEMINTLDIVRQNIEQAIKNSYTSTLSLSLTIDDKGVPQNFDKIAAKLIDSNYQALQLVPNGIIKYVYPFKPNQQALGYNIFNGSPPNVARAYTAIASRKMYFIGPDKLWQGGTGIVGRLPIYLNNKFWGFSAVVIKLHNFLKVAGIDNKLDSKFYFQFSRLNVTTNSEEFFLEGSSSFSDHEFESITFPEGNWRLYLIAKDKLDIFYQLLYPFIFGIVLALFCSILIIELLKKPQQLQRMVDASKQDLRQSFQMVTEQNKRLLNFSYIVSHNLRSHTSNIQAISALIENTTDETERQELLGLMKTVSSTLNETLLNLNKVVNINTNINEIKEQLSLREHVDKTIGVLNDQIIQTKAQVTNLVPANAMVNFNPAYLESILLNFIFNSIRYSSPDRKPVIEVCSSIENNRISLQIIDNGIGIDLEKHGDHVFGMYKTFTDHKDAKGIGLFISKNQIDAMGGTVTIQSTLNQGTTITIFFS